jgi:integrase
MVLLNELFTEAVENGYVTKNPARKVSIPRCKAPQETRAMVEAEVRRLFEKTEGRDRLMWRTLLLTGIRVGELLALRKPDMASGTLCIDESSFEGKSSTTKNRKTRFVPIPQSLWSELESWASGVKGDLLFPTSTGTMYGRSAIRSRTC